MITELKIYKMFPNVNLPVFATKESACFDLAFQPEGKSIVSGFNAYNGSFARTCSSGSILIAPQERMMIPTGLILDIPEGYSVRLHPRSGLALRRGITLVNAEAVIDSDYVEELLILVMNVSNNNYTIENGERIAQGELVKAEKYVINETKIEPSIKGDRDGGIGSTGKIKIVAG